MAFVRDLFADVEKLPAFLRVASHLREGTGRIRVSGLTPTAKALLLVLLQKAAGRPFIVVVPDNRAAEEFVPVLQASTKLLAGTTRIPWSLCRRAMSCHSRISHRIPRFRKSAPSPFGKLPPARFPFWFRRLQRRLFAFVPAEYYADLARMVRRGETLDIEPLLRHLNTVGYASTDVVEMPGEYAIRGGILDVYSPEADRPLRIEFFGDEVESIRKFDPATQRSSTPVDEALLLPLTETPVSDDLLGAIHVRLSGKRITGAEEVVEQAVRSGGVSVFPGWEFYAPVAGADRTVFDLLPHAVVLVDEPDSSETGVRSHLVANRRGARTQRGRQPGAAYGSISSIPMIGGENWQAFPGPRLSISKSRVRAKPRQSPSIRSQRSDSMARFQQCWRRLRSRSGNRIAC